MKKTLQTNIAMNDSSLDCVIPTQSSVIQTIHCNVDLKCFFSTLPKCLFVIIVMYAYFIDISQSNVKTHLLCGGIIIFRLLYIVCRVCHRKNFENRSITGMDK